MRKGWKTSEFWVAVVGALLPVVKNYVYPELPVETVYTLIAYIIGRCFVKGMRPTDIE